MVGAADARARACRARLAAAGGRALFGEEPAGLCRLHAQDAVSARALCVVTSPAVVETCPTRGRARPASTGLLSSSSLCHCVEAFACAYDLGVVFSRPAPQGIHRCQ